MKVGILGTNFGAFHASVYKRQPNIEAVRIWGRNGAKLEKLHAELGVETTTDMNDILNDPDVELVDVCLPTALHRECVVRALQAGKHVYCETPLCTTIEDAGAILDAERKSGKRLYVDQFTKFLPEYQLVKEAAAGGRYGRLLAIKAWRNTAPVWGKLGNDAIATNLMIHELDFATWLFGEPARIEARAQAKNEGETYVEAALRYPDALVSISACSMMPPGYPFTAGFIAMFENAAIQSSCVFENDFPKKTTLEYANGAVRSIDLPLRDPYELAIEHVLDCCRTGRDSDISGEAAAMAARAAMEITSQISSFYY